jgi:putative transposase
MQNLGNKTLREIASECNSVDEILDVMKSLFRETLQLVLEAEVEEHLGYTKHSTSGINTGNSRNGYRKKTLRTKFGETLIQIPRDRNGDFEPKIVKNYESSINGLEEQIIALYSKGMTTRDIESHMNDLYGIEASPSLISRITDKIIPLALEWQSRPLDQIYPIVYLDAIHFKVKQENRIVSKAAYTVLGINMDGEKDILGIWIGENESASFWLSVLTDLKSRGVEDIFIACIDGLKGFPEAIQAVFPRTNIQLCVIHQIRNSMKYVPSKNRQEFMNSLKKVYKAYTLQEAELEFGKLKDAWGAKYEKAVSPWENNWLELTSYFAYTPDIRRMIYTTNTVESYHRQLRKVTKSKTAYPTDNALRKIIYLSTIKTIEKWGKPLNWDELKAQLKIQFADRLGV